MSTFPMGNSYLADIPRFERLLVCLSLPTKHPPEEQIRTTIAATQAALGGLHKLQHKQLAQWDENSKLFIVSNPIDADGGETYPSFTGQDAPWMAYRVFSGNVFQFSTRSELSADVAKEVDTLFDAEINPASSCRSRTELKDSDSCALDRHGRKFTGQQNYGRRC